jgi:hypothetical protein
LRLALIPIFSPCMIFEVSDSMASGFDSLSDVL